jgi:hypothetical protein
MLAGTVDVAYRWILEIGAANAMSIGNPSGQPAPTPGADPADAAQQAGGSNPAPAQPSPQVPPPQTQARPVGLTIFLFGSVLTFLIAAIVAQFQDVDMAIKAALWAMAATAVFWVAMPLVWVFANYPSSPGSDAEPERTPPLRDEANVLITVDGIVLGLIYAFVGDKGPVPAVVKVGSISLVVGAIIALMLHSLTVGRIHTLRVMQIGNGLYHLASWSLVFGLWCIAFALIYR